MNYFVIAGKESFTMLQKLAADVDGDGKILASDWRLISSRNVNNIKVFPVDGDLNQDGYNI